MRLMRGFGWDSDVALEAAAEDQRIDQLREMMAGWPFSAPHRYAWRWFWQRQNCAIAPAITSRTLVDEPGVAPWGEKSAPALEPLQFSGAGTETANHLLADEHSICSFL